MIFKQLYDPRSGALSYLLGDPIGSEGVLIDPIYEQAGEYLRLLRLFGLRLRYLVETRLPDGHISASPVLREETGARVAIHGAAELGCADLRIQHGDLLHFGEETLGVLHAPGVSPCASAFRWNDRLFTGETLLVGRLGCPDGQGGNARTLCDSVRQTLFSLPPETLVFPGRDWDGRRVSSLAQERNTNPDLQAPSCAEALEGRCKDDPLAVGDSDLRAINEQCAARNLPHDGFASPTQMEGASHV